VGFRVTLSTIPGQLGTEKNYEAQNPSGYGYEIGWPSGLSRGPTSERSGGTPPRSVTRMSLILYRGELKGNRETQLGVA